ncbi:MAG: class III signal peptide-containing protein [Candidatus Omnitrophica bacterium]|nr:class III signal peptide-containing protein [Candidatus Omnitrophota bacterium]
MFKRKGQSTLEYVIILTAIVAAVIIASRLVGTKVQSSLEGVSTKMDTKVQNMNLGGN